MTSNISTFVLKNRLLMSMIVFTVFFGITMIIKPNFIINNDGSFREFGVGTTSKTVIPMWVFVIFIALMSYYAVNYSIVFSKLEF